MHGSRRALWVSSLLLVVAGALLLASGPVAAWAHGRYRILGHAIAYAVLDTGAWDGYLWPALPWATLAGIPMIAGGIPGLVGRRAPVGYLLGMLAGACAFGLLGGLLAAPAWPPVRVKLLPWSMAPGPLVAAGAALSLVALASGFVGWLQARPSVRGAAVLPGVAAIAVVALLGTGIYVTPLITPPAVDAVAPLMIDPIPDWHTHPEEPYPFTQPVPLPLVTTADGIFVRTPDGSSPDAGTSTLRLVRGRFELLHDVPPSRATGHYAIAGDRITFLNQPVCGRTLGEYRWSIVDGVLHLELLSDSCAGGQRGRDLTAGTWRLIGGP